MATGQLTPTKVLLHQCRWMSVITTAYSQFTKLSKSEYFRDHFSSVFSQRTTLATGMGVWIEGTTSLQKKCCHQEILQCGINYQQSVRAESQELGQRKYSFRIIICATLTKVVNTPGSSQHKQPHPGLWVASVYKKSNVLNDRRQ